MKRSKLLGVALMAVFVLGVIGATTASAEVTKILPELKSITVKTKSGKGTLLTVGGSQVICQKDKGTGEFTTPNLGTFHTTFEECKAKIVIGSAACTGVGDEKEKILLLGTVHYVLALLMEGKPKEEKAAKLVAALAFLFEELHFTCEAFGQKELILVKGCAAANAEPTEKLTNKTKDTFKEFSSGESSILEILLEEATKETPCLTETNVGGKGFELSAETGVAENETSVEVLLMN